MQHLYSSANYLEANTIKAMLVNAGISVHLFGEQLCGALGELPANVSEIDIYVFEEQFEKALVLINEYRTSEARSKVHWSCSRCGEENAPQFEICWCCGEEP